MKKSRTRKLADRQVEGIESYQKVFRGVDGEKVLFDLMEKHYVLNSTIAPGVDPNLVLVREGERNVVLRILALLKVNPRQLRERIEAHAEAMGE